VATHVAGIHQTLVTTQHVAFNSNLRLTITNERISSHMSPLLINSGKKVLISGHIVMPLMNLFFVVYFFIGGILIIFGSLGYGGYYPN